MKNLEILFVTGNFPYTILRNRVKGILNTDTYNKFEVIKMPEKERSEIMKIAWFLMFKEGLKEGDNKFVIYTYDKFIMNLFLTFNKVLNSDVNGLEKLSFQSVDNVFLKDNNIVFKETFLEIIDIKNGLDNIELSTFFEKRE